MPLPPALARVVTGSRVSLDSTSGSMPGPLSVKRIQLLVGPRTGVSSPSSIRSRGAGPPRSTSKAFLASVHSTRYSRSRRPGSLKSPDNSLSTQERSSPSNGYSSSRLRTRLAALTVSSTAPGYASRADCTKVDTSDWQ